MRPTISIVLVALIITAGQPTRANAQDVPVLAGVSTAKFEMEDLDAGGRRCGLNSNALLNALKLPIRAYTKIHAITEGAEVPFFVLRVQTVAQKLRNETLCVSALVLQLNQIALVDVPGQKPMLLTAMLWEGQRMISGALSDSPIRTMRTVELLALEFAAQWQTDNP